MHEHNARLYRHLKRFMTKWHALHINDTLVPVSCPRSPSAIAPSRSDTNALYLRHISASDSIPTRRARSHPVQPGAVRSGD